MKETKVKENYDIYADSVKNNIALVKSCIRHGSILTRTEKFDCIFKMYNVDKEKDAKEIYLTSRDRAKVQFLSYCFRLATIKYDYGYSIKDAKKAFKKVRKESRSFHAPRTKCKLHDMNGILYADVFYKGNYIYGFEIEDSEDLALTLTCYAGYLAGLTEYVNDETIKFVEDLAYNNMCSYIDRTGVSPYVDRNRYSLMDALPRTMRATRANRNEKVISFRAV